jgi:hypothetical protein
MALGASSSSTPPPAWTTPISCTSTRVPLRVLVPRLIRSSEAIMSSGSLVWTSTVMARSPVSSPPS